MGENSKIEWTDHSFNPWWGCTKESAGCANCYAEAQAARWGSWFGADVPRRKMSDAYWREPLKWNKKALAEGVRRRVFCASMADICEDRDDLLTYRAELMRLIEQTPALDWLLLTKRPWNFNKMFGRRWNSDWPENVWAGTTAENQDAADIRVPNLCDIQKAKVRFLSCEPLIGQVNLNNVLGMGILYGTFEAVNWVIAGAETGPRKRPMDPAWARMLRDQCKDAGVEFFFKKDSQGLAELDGVVHHEFPQVAARFC